MTYITDIKQAQSLLAQNDIKLITFNHNIRYDNYLSQMYYDDFVNGATGFDVVTYGKRQTDYMVVYSSDTDKYDKYYTEEYLLTLDNTELVELLDSLELYNYDEDDVDDMRYQLSQVSISDYYDGHFASSSFYDLDCDLDICGYSQGDRMKIKLVGSEAQSLTDEGMTNLVYDSPISGSIEVFINGELEDEIYIDEILVSPYEYWEKGDFIANLNKYITEDYKDLLLEWCEEELPSGLDYSY